MTYLIIFIAFLMLLSVLLLVFKIREANIHKALNLPRHTNPTNDSFVQAREIGRFLHQRATACNIYFHNTPDTSGVDPKVFHRISSGEECSVAQLVRLCHAVGCEIVIRQMDTDDMEDRTNTPTAFAEKIITMQENRAM